MVQNVAMIDKISHIGPAEVHSEGYAGIVTDPIPVGNVHCVEELLLFRRQWVPISGQHQEMDLMHVKLMIFLGAVLDCPVLHRSLRRNNRRRFIRAEWPRSLS